MDGAHSFNRGTSSMAVLVEENDKTQILIKVSQNHSGELYSSLNNPQISVTVVSVFTF
jgi:hypothetical protein